MTDRSWRWYLLGDEGEERINLIRPNRNKETDTHHDRVRELHYPPAFPPEPKTEQPERQPEPPNWVEKWGFWVLVFTLLAAAAAAIEAHRLVNATNGAIETASIDARKQRGIATDTEHRQLRAYLHPIIDEIVDLDKNPLEWTYQIKNFGVTPACHVRTSGQLYVGPTEFAAWTATPNPNQINHWGVEPNYCVAPQQEHSIPLSLKFDRAQFLSAEEKSAIEWGAAILLFAHGTIYYDDVFGDPHTTQFRIAYGGPIALQTKKMDWCAGGNQAN